MSSTFEKTQCCINFTNTLSNMCDIHTCNIGESIVIFTCEQCDNIFDYSFTVISNSFKIENFLPTQQNVIVT